METLVLGCYNTDAMAITTEDVKKIAKLVKLDVAGQEETLSKMFSETLDYINMLGELDTQKVDRTSQVTGTQNVFQQSDPSAPNKTLEPAKALLNAKSQENNLFETSGVLNRQ